MRKKEGKARGRKKGKMRDKRKRGKNKRGTMRRKTEREARRKEKKEGEAKTVKVHRDKEKGRKIQKETSLI